MGIIYQKRYTDYEGGRNMKEGEICRQIWINN